MHAAMLCVPRCLPNPPLPLAPNPAAVCAAYVAEHPANAQLTRALHWALRQVASVLLLGTRLVLAGAADAASTADLCVDVVWALEVGAAGAGRSGNGLRMR